MEPETRKCKKCGETKPLIEGFHPHDGGGRRHECKACFRQRFNAWAASRRPITNAQAKAGYHRRKAENPEWYERRKADRRIGNRLGETTASYARRQRDDAYAAYGGPICACCGETEVMFLTLDHIENNGKEMRKQHGLGSAFYAWLKRNSWPAGFQVLCMNCNFGKARNKGVCPHKSHQEPSTAIPNGSTAKRPEAPRTLRGDDIA